MELSKAIFSRTERLLGNDTIDKISQHKVIIFGVGGVGSWAAESLVRSGITQLTIVDSDRVNVTNINRQLMATTKTIGMVKVDALKTRLLDINPNAHINAIQEIYTENTADSFNLNNYDVIIDAIDSLKDKALLIINACKTKAVFVSSMGAALKMDPTKIQVAEFWKVKGCPLGHALRKKFKHNKITPARKFKCVFSEEVLENLGDDTSANIDNSQFEVTHDNTGKAELLTHDWNNTKAQINGTMAHITAIFGFMIAGIVMQEITKNNKEDIE